MFTPFTDMVYNYCGGIMYFLSGNIYHYSDKEYLTFYHKLNDHDKKKVDLLINENDKKLFLLSRILLSKLTCKYYSINFFNLDIKYNDCGKPYADEFYFNISHSYDYAVVVSSNKMVGVDIEKIRDIDSKMVRYVCSESEEKYVLSSDDRNKAFFQIFCLKEAYVKMIGTGIKDLGTVEFLIQNNTVICPIHPNLNIVLNSDIDGYIIAIVEESN